MSTRHSLEIAVTRVRDARTYDILQRQAHRHIGQAPGFLRGFALRGSRDPSLRADVLLWASHEEAQQASEAMQKDPRFADFLGAMEELVCFDHFHGEDLSVGLTLLMASPIVEIAIYPDAPSGDLGALQARIHQNLEELATGSLALASQTRRADVIGWRDVNAHTSAPEQLLAADPGLAPFFEAASAPHVFALFEVLP